MINCRICKGKLKKIVDLGKIALVGDFIKKLKKQKKYKISINFCSICKHVQIAEILNPNLLFKKYLWETGVSSSNILLIKDLIKKIKKYGINKNSKILEIASNDGSLLSFINKEYKCLSVGIDPAKNLKKKIKNKKIITIVNYFDFNQSKNIKKKFKIFDYIFARNVLAHVPDPNQIFKGVKNLLSENGKFILEVPHLDNIIRYNQYDNIFHEHIGFHSLKSIIDLTNRYNLKVFDVEKIDSQGGSLRCFISNKNSSDKISNEIKSVIKEEKKLGLYSPTKLMKFRIKIISHIRKLKKLLQNLKKKNNKISIYGASGKGQALMQFCNINNKIVDFAFDKSKLKQGCLTPGTQIKVKDPKDIKKTDIQYLLLLSWNLKKEIIKQEKNFIKKGGKFIVPFPSPKIIKK
jgi:SAM-dependent methyltransferase